MDDPKQIGPDVLATTARVADKYRASVSQEEQRAWIEKRRAAKLDDEKRAAFRDPRVGVPQGPGLLELALRRGTGKAAAACREAYRFAFGARPRRTVTLWLIGPAGTGKTTSATRLVLHHEAIGRMAAYLRAGAIPGVRNYANAEVYDRARRAELLVVDEIGTEPDPKVISALVCERHDHERVTVLIGNLQPQQCVERYQLMSDERVRSRMAQLRRQGFPPVRAINERDFRAEGSQ